MICPIIVYGDPILRKQCKEVNPAYPSLDLLIKNMFDTMYHAKGLGLAAPQIGLNLRLFIVDTSYLDLNRKIQKYKQVFINAKIIRYQGKKEVFREGCLSLPSLLEKLERNYIIKVEYYDENWEKKSISLTGLLARIIQHEYDHIQGKLVIDYLSYLKLALINCKLQKISIGNINTNYPIKKYKNKKLIWRNKRY